MSQIFTSFDVMDPAKERDWAANIGMLDWDNTRIVFTKRQLLEFLKYTGTTVDTNFNNISKLPRFAQFGKFTANTEPNAASAADDNEQAQPAAQVTTSNSHGNIFSDEQAGALDTAPPPQEDKDAFIPTRRVREGPGGKSTIGSIFGGDDGTKEAFIPTRRVREIPGGQDHIGGIF